MIGGYTFCPLDEYPGPNHECSMATKGLAFLLREGITTTANLAKLKGDITDRRKTGVLREHWCAQANDRA